jgi:hypothetical protein
VHLVVVVSATAIIDPACAGRRDQRWCTWWSRRFAPAGGDSEDPGKAETLANFLRDVACGGQISMDRIGYALLPPNLSQAIGDGIARLWGPAFPAEHFDASNCANPRFVTG